MLPNNYVVGGQPGLPQPQPQPGPQQGMSNMAMDQTRLWQLQQQQQQQQQIVAQLRAQQQGNGGQVNQQILEFMRQRGLQGNPQAMAQQRQFASMAQLGVNNPPFPHDPSQALQNAQPQFGNAPGGQNFANQLHLQALQRNPSQMFPGQGGTMRQLDLMMAQNPQNQNGVPNPNTMAAALQRQIAQQQQQQQQQQHSQQPQPSHQQPPQMGAPQLPPGIFGNMNPAQMQPNLQNIHQQSTMGPNRAAGVMLSQMQDGQMQGQQPRRPISLQEMQVKANEFRQAIAAGENRIKNLQNQVMTNQIPHDAVAQEINKVQKELLERRTALNKILNYMAAKSANGTLTAGFQNGVDMKALAASPVPTQRLPGGPTNPSQVGWMQGSSQNPQFNSPRPMSTTAHLVPNQTPQSSTAPMSTPQLPPQVASQSNQPQRAVPTPLPVPSHGGAQNGRPLANNVGVSGFSYAPLSRDNFTKAYFQQWVPKHPVDQSMLSFEGRNIDIYMLHAEVMSQNGFRCALQPPVPGQPPQLMPALTISQDQWSIIAGRLGFVNFPGNDHEPARSGPGIAVHLERVYKQCLHDFDVQYLRQLFYHRRMSSLGQPTKANGAENSGGAPQAPQVELNPKSLSEMVSYANHSVQELQSRGVPNHIIALVEKHRDQLKLMLDSQRNFTQGIQNAAPQGQARNVSNPAINNVKGMLHHQAGMNGIGKPPMQPGQAQPPMSMQSTSAMPQNAQPQQRPGAGIPIATGRPTPAQMSMALELVRRLKEENKNVSFPTTRPMHIPDAQRLEYNAQFEYLHRLVTGLDQKLAHFAVCMKEEAIKKLVVVIYLVQHQREALSSNPTQYYMPIQWVQAMISQVNWANQHFQSWVSSAMRQPDGSQPTQAGPSNPQVRPPVPPARPPTAQPASTPSALTPPGPPAHTPGASAVSPQVTGTPSISKKATPKASGDVASAATPPQTPKSPKNKPAKPKQPPKSRKKPTAVAAGSSPNAGPSETKAPATPAAATPASAPTPESTTGSKRPREEEPMASTSASAPPSAKKIKTEWDEAPSDALAKRQEEADKVKSEEETVKFLEQMSSWLTQIGGDGDGQDSLKTEIAESLDEILKAYPAVADDGTSSLAASNFIDSINVGSSSPRQMVDPADFFDFTSYGLPEEDAGSKADTPDLVQASSSVGPSPGSASESEVHLGASTGSTRADTAKIVEPKGELSGGDSMSQDLWRAIDGGEASFYHSSDNWKWDQPMQALEQPWAIYSSS